MSSDVATPARGRSWKVPETSTTSTGAVEPGGGEQEVHDAIAVQILAISRSTWLAPYSPPICARFRALFLPVHLEPVKVVTHTLSR